MTFIDGAEIINIFNALNNASLDYILLRNINNELPFGLKVGKDIDILVNKKDEDKFISFFRKEKYEQISHPFAYDTYMYGMDRFIFKYNNSSKILFDINFQIAVRSLDNGQWIPLDRNIQISAWKHKRKEKLDNGLCYYTLSYEDELVALIARSMFDKRKFQKEYIARIEFLLTVINFPDTMLKLELVFFKFTPTLIQMIFDKKYSNILNTYYRFKDY